MGSYRTLGRCRSSPPCGTPKPQGRWAGWARLEATHRVGETAPPSLSQERESCSPPPPQASGQPRSPPASAGTHPDRSTESLAQPRSSGEQLGEKEEREDQPRGHRGRGAPGQEWRGWSGRELGPCRESGCLSGEGRGGRRGFTERKKCGGGGGEKETVREK